VYAAPNLEARDALAAGMDLLAREHVYLDEQRWDEWLALYAPDCEYWVPAWKNEESLTCDPRAELSHIYYASRAGLEDRVVRIRSRRSPASTPLPRTTHLLGNVLPVAGAPGGSLRLRSSWVCHVFFPREHASHAFFGRAEHELAARDGRWVIQKKKTLLLNDYIPTMLDVYCIYTNPGPPPFFPAKRGPVPSGKP
jgi:3-phenylpropionate/cinnamic acid dioxygenase small subunit